MTTQYNGNETGRIDPPPEPEVTATEKAVMRDKSDLPSRLRNAMSGLAAGGVYEAWDEHVCVLSDDWWGVWNVSLHIRGNIHPDHTAAERLGEYLIALGKELRGILA